MEAPTAASTAPGRVAWTPLSVTAGLVSIGLFLSQVFLMYLLLGLQSRLALLFITWPLYVGPALVAAGLAMSGLARQASERNANLGLMTATLAGALWLLFLLKGL